MWIAAAPTAYPRASLHQLVSDDPESKRPSSPCSQEFQTASTGFRAPERGACFWDLIMRLWTEQDSQGSGEEGPRPEIGRGEE